MWWFSAYSKFMKKSLLAFVSISAIVLGSASQVHAADSAPKKTIAIIDTAIDSSKVPQVVYEACINDNRSCPNGTSFQEGKGAANVPTAGWTINGMSHGYEVTQSALSANPNLNIVFVRITNFTDATKNYEAYMHTSGASLANAVQWVATNAKKLNISAVSISQDRENFAVGTCPADAVFSGAVQSLKAIDVPVLAGVGNSATVNRPGFPACLPDVIGVGGATATGQIYYFSNTGPGVDLMSLGRTNITGLDGRPQAVIGTSIATPWAAALWVKNFSGTYANQLSQMAALKTIKDPIKGTYPWLF
jgi:hypothetical protein